jgi:hypothetical protein
VVTVKEPLEFFLGFGERARAVWEVRPDLRVAVKPVERIQVAHIEMSKRQTLCLQDYHGTKGGGCEAKRLS